MENIGLSEFKVIEKIDDEYGNILYIVKPVQPDRICPMCGRSGCYSHDRQERYVRDMNEHGKFVELCIRYNRYICPDCGKIFTPEFNSIEPNGKMTKRLKAALANESIHRPFTNVANSYGISKTSTRNSFIKYAENFDAEWVVKTPEILGIDECHLARRPRSIFTDVKESKILELRENNKKKTVIEVLNSFKEPEKIKAVTMDMTVGYRDAVLECLPHAIIVIDKFHVLQTVLKATSDTYTKVRKSMYEYFAGLPDGDEKLKAYKKLHIAVTLFRMNAEDYTSKHIDILAELIKLYPDFAKIITIKDDFRKIFNKTKTRKEAEAQYFEWKKSLPKNDERFKPFFEVVKTVDRWHKWIFNYFDCKVTNASVEATNGIIKKMNSLGRGYSFEMLRIKVLRANSAVKRPKYIRPRKKPSDIDTTMKLSVLNSTNPSRHDQSVGTAVLSSGSGVDIYAMNEYLDELIEIGV